MINKEPKKRRWYDKYPKLNKILELLREYSEDELEIILKDVIDAANIIKKNRAESEFISIGADKVTGLYHAQNKNRWYDKSQTLNLAMNVLTVMVEEDFVNVTDTLFETLFRT